MFKNRFLYTLNLHTAKITYDDFDIDINYSFEQQELCYKEDLIQIQCSPTTLIDVGWYPEFDKNGSFCIEIIENHDWEKPFWQKKTNDLKMLRKLLQNALDICHSHAQYEKLSAGVMCCICNKSIYSSDVDPCDISFMSNWDKERERQHDQIFWCHYECFRKCLHPNIQKYLALDILSQSQNDDESWNIQ